MAVLLSEIILDGKDLTDLLNNPVVGDPTWRRWINQGVERLYRMLVMGDQARFHKSATFALTGIGGNTVALAADFRKLREQGVTRNPAVPGSRQTLRRFNFAERDAQGGWPTWWTELGYDIQAGNIVVEPASASAGNYAYYYLAGPVKWLTDGSQDGVAIATVFEPYVDFVAHWAAVKAAGKDESNSADLREDFKALEDEIQAEFGSGSDPATIIDTSATGGGMWP